MLLNQTYYQALLNKFSSVETLPNELNLKSSLLTLKLILDQSKKNKPIHINFQNHSKILFDIGKQLFIELANNIYINFYDLPSNYEVGEKLKRIIDNQYYEIIKADNNKYTLQQVLRKSQRDISPAIRPDLTYDKLIKGFVKIDSGISETTIKNYFNFFKILNNQHNDFPQTNFERKSVFIARKTFWDELTIKNKIPSVYLPNPREDCNSHETRSIPALPDCIMYFTPKYEVCYQKILQQGKRIDTIVVYDTEEDKIEQILQDRKRFGFNLILLTSSTNPSKNSQIPCWDWFKEEIHLVNSL